MFTALLATIGVMSAMHQEAQLIEEHIENKEIVQVGVHQFVKGDFDGVPIVFTLAGVGKVSAAATATLLISKFGVDEIVFTGVAGGGKGAEIGDVVIGSSYLQHDLDLQPIFPQFHILSLNQQLLHGDGEQASRMRAAAERYLESGIEFPDLGITAPKVHSGVIVSGDQFIATTAAHQEIVDKTQKILPNGFHAIEMEGAAVAQVCKELQVPFVVMRSISDKANHDAAVDFLAFMSRVASHYSFEILREYLKEAPK